MAEPKKKPAPKIKDLAVPAKTAKALKGGLYPVDGDIIYGRVNPGPVRKR